MKIGILGLPKAGKTTLFNLLTVSEQATDKFTASVAVHLGVARVPDPRLRALRDLFRPKKFSPATVEYVDVPGLHRDGAGQELNLPELKNLDALLHVVRAFEDPEIVHAAGSIDPARDIALVDLELILADLVLVERRLERLTAAAKRGSKPEEESEQRLLAEVIRPALEAERPLRELALAPADEKSLRGFQLLSAKPMLVAINVAEGRIGEPPAAFGIEPREGTAAVVVSAPIEAEIARLAPADQTEFLADLGLEEPSLDRLIRASYRLLGVISFFTVGEDEVKAWTVRRGSSAQAAAGAIHSDIARGFIRAEVVDWRELVDRGSLAACRDTGVLRLEGRDYEVRDGDVLNVRFAV